MQLTFKVMFQKEWTLLDDRIIRGNKEILLSDIESVELSNDINTGINGAIIVKVKNRFIFLDYSNSDKENGNIAFKHLQENYGTYDMRSRDTSIKDNYNKKVSRIMDELESLNTDGIYLGCKEIIELPNYIDDNEHVKGIVRGIPNWEEDGEFWIILCTDNRLLMLNKNKYNLIKTFNISLGGISNVSYTQNTLKSKLTFNTAHGIKEIDKIYTSVISDFSNALIKQIQKYNRSKSIPNLSHSNFSVADELLKFKQLLDMGVLTQDEFDSKKKELLS